MSGPGMGAKGSESTVILLTAWIEILAPTSHSSQLPVTISVEIPTSLSDFFGYLECPPHTLKQNK